MIEWQKVRLGDVCDIFNGSTPLKTNDDYWKGGNIPWFKVDDIKTNGRIIKKTKLKITQKALDETSVKILPKNTILLCCTASVGEYALTDIELTTNQQFNGLVVKNENELFYKYLFWVCSTLKKVLLKKSGKAVIDFVSITKLKDILIPLPSIKVQEKIVKELDAVGELIEKQKQLLKEQDNLIKSAFYDLFGDPVASNKFLRDILKEKGSWQTGGTPSRKCPEYFNGEHPWITTTSLGKTYISELNAVDYISDEGVKNSSTKIIPSNSLLFGIRVGVGKTSINTCPICTSQDIVSFTPRNNDYNLIYLHFFFEFIKGHILKKARGATIKGITTDILKETSVITPPIDLQNRFASIVEKIEGQKTTIQKSLEESQALFSALMAKYFEE